MKVGSFLKGVGSGLQMFPQIQEMKWKKAELKAIEKEKEDWKDAIAVFQGKLEEYSSATNLSYGQQMEIISATAGLGHEFANVMQDLMSDINQGNREAAKQKHELLKAYTDFTLSTGFPIEGVENILSKDTMKYIQQGNILKETGGKTGEAMGRQTWKERGFGEIPLTPEKLSVLEKKIAGIEKLPLTKERMNELKIKIYAGGDSAIAEKVRAIYAAGGTNEDVVKALGGGVIGAGPKPETVTTLKNWEDMFDMKKEEGIKTEEEYNRVLNLLAQSEDTYKPKYATWKEALIAEVKGIAKELKGITDKEDFNTLLDVYMQKLEEIKTKYPDVDLNQFPEFEEQKGWFDKLKEKVGL